MFRAQLSTLFDRNLAVLLGSPGSLAVMTLQPPLIGFLIGLAWEADSAQPTTYFVFVLSSIYLGCMNACTAIVGERAIFERERMSGVQLWPYLLAKLQMFIIVALMQSALLLVVAAQWLVLPGGLFEHAATFAVLTACCVSAASLGLLISAVAKSPYMAVVLVPVAVLPQIIFSRAVLGARLDDAVLTKVSWLTISRWGYDSVVAATLDFDAGTLIGSPLVLLVMTVALSLATAFQLKLPEWVR